VVQVLAHVVQPVEHVAALPHEVLQSLKQRRAFRFLV
jgi:hypothetical protein